MFVGAFRINVQEPTRGDEVLGHCCGVLLVKRTQLTLQFLIEFLAGDFFGNRRFLDPRPAGALLACIFAGIG
ncbi:hypothetical protein GCM10009691_12650 [Brevibacterium picturae]|uniref:Uncharacterized protein n=1 Tax=Brevibacterium picturae TaxID=260553 RepID=A0ABN2BF44_9MICO